MITAIILAVSFVAGGFLCSWIATRRSRIANLQLRPARQSMPIREPDPRGSVVLRYSSGTTVVLDDAALQRRTAAGSVVSPMPRRRLPGLMPTAGYVVIQKSRPSRGIPRMKSIDTSDEN